MLDGAEDFYWEIPGPPASHERLIQAFSRKFACQPTGIFLISRWDRPSLLICRVEVELRRSIYPHIILCQ